MTTLGTLFLDSTRSDNPLDSHTTGDTNPAGQQKVLDFLTLQSLSFPLASAGVSIAWKVLQATISQNWVERNWVALVIAGVIILASWFSQWTQLGSTPARVGGFLIGAVNALLLSAAALGIETKF
jgi:hypothetical protein